MVLHFSSLSLFHYYVDIYFYNCIIYYHLHEHAIALDSTAQATLVHSILYNNNNLIIMITIITIMHPCSLSLSYIEQMLC